MPKHTHLSEVLRRAMIRFSPEMCESIRSLMSLILSFDRFTRSSIHNSSLMLDFRKS